MCLSQSTLLGSELLDMAASHVNIKEREYFGLYTEGEGYVLQTITFRRIIVTVLEICLRLV